MNTELIRNARAAGYYVSWLNPSPVARACAALIGAKNLSMCPALTVLRKD